MSQYFSGPQQVEGHAQRLTAPLPPSLRPAGAATWPCVAASAACPSAASPPPARSASTAATGATSAPGSAAERRQQRPVPRVAAANVGLNATRTKTRKLLRAELEDCEEPLIFRPRLDSIAFEFGARYQCGCPRCCPNLDLNQDFVKLTSKLVGTFDCTVMESEELCGENRFE